MLGGMLGEQLAKMLTRSIMRNLGNVPLIDESGKQVEQEEPKEPGAPREGEEPGANPPKQTTPVQGGGNIVEYLTGDRSHSNYRQDHGGGNYHEHLAFSSVEERDRAIAVLQQNGITIGSMNDGRHAPGSYHYSDLAFDVPFYPNQSNLDFTDDRVGEEAFSDYVRSLLANNGFSGSGIVGSPADVKPAGSFTDVKAAPKPTPNIKPTRHEGKGTKAARESRENQTSEPKIVEFGGNRYLQLPDGTLTSPTNDSVKKISSLTRYMDYEGGGDIVVPYVIPPSVSGGVMQRQSKRQSVVTMGATHLKVEKKLNKNRSSAAGYLN